MDESNPTRPASIEDAIKLYLRTGQHDECSSIWPGRTIVDRATYAEDCLRSALVAEVERRTDGERATPTAAEVDLVALTRLRVEPMVRGLFQPPEQEIVLGVLERSVVLLSHANVATVLREVAWLHTAWELANLYLGSRRVPLLGPDATPIVGLAEETTCYITEDYFHEQGRFADFIVHEAAHVFHNCKRRTIGLPESRTREWPLELDYVKRELFAFCCEAYTRILEHGATRAERLALVAELAGGPMPADERVDAAEYVDLLREAAGARNGWKRILARCSPAPRRTRSSIGG